MAEFDVCQSHVQSLDKFLNRHKNLGIPWSQNKEFVKAFKRLLRLNRYDKKEKEAFLSYLEDAKGLIEKLWFISKV